MNFRKAHMPPATTLPAPPSPAPGKLDVPYQWAQIDVSQIPSPEQNDLQQHIQSLLDSGGTWDSPPVPMPVVYPGEFAGWAEVAAVVGAYGGGGAVVGAYGAIVIVQGSWPGAPAQVSSYWAYSQHPSTTPSPQGGAPAYSQGGVHRPIFIQGLGMSINSQLAPAGLGVVQRGGGPVQGGGPVPQPDIDAAESWIDSTSSAISTLGGQNLFTAGNAQKSVSQLQQDINAALAKDFGNVGAPAGNAPGTVTGSFGNQTSTAFGWWDNTEWQNIVADVNGVAQDAATVGDDVNKLSALGNFVAQGNYPGGLQSYGSQLQTIRSMLEELRAARQTIATLQGQVNSLQTQVSDPNTGIASLQSQLASAQASVAAALQGCGS